jgi:hypothetical protein
METRPAAKEADVRAGLTFVLIAIAASSSFAQAPAARPYDGIQAGLDAFRLAEEQRQAAVANQLAINDQMRAWAALPPVRGYTTYYGYPGYTVPAIGPADLDYAYAYAYGFPRLRVGLPVGAPTVFEPWPVIPGDIYGYTYIAPLRQPVGQWQGQTGPRRWESHPVYDPPLPALVPQPVVESPLLDKTPYATPRRGPREF